ncbi:hypothetical protein D1007_19301 [Hordeum vulgare]|nr:hypothetical protein D1007_19301 [Hordeum vulgare]
MPAPHHRRPLLSFATPLRSAVAGSAPPAVVAVSTCCPVTEGLCSREFCPYDACTLGTGCASNQDMQLYIVVTRLACIAFSTAAFVLAMAAPESQQFSFVVALKGSMLTQLSWTSMRMLYQAICWYFGEVHLDRIAPVLFNDMVARSYPHP